MILATRLSNRQATDSLVLIRIKPTRETIAKKRKIARPMKKRFLRWESGLMIYMGYTARVGSHLQHDGYRAIIVDLDEHMRAENATTRRHTQPR